MRLLLLFCLSVFYIQTIAAQPPLLSRSSDRLRIDPRGGLPMWVNDPLPFVGHPVSQCVKDNERIADYYHWDEHSGWVLEQTVVREYQTEGNRVREFHRYHDDVLRSSESDILMDREGRLISSEIRNVDADGNTETILHELRYDKGLLVKEDSYEISAGTKRRIRSMENTLSFDGSGAITNILSKSFAGDEAYNSVVYDLSYSNGRLKEIQQSSLEVQTGRITPVFRYALTESDAKGDWRFTALNSELYGDEGWTGFRKDSLVRNDKNELRWAGVLQDARQGSSIQSTRTVFDENGNMTDFMQYSGTSSTGEPVLTGHLRLRITYDADGVTPSSVTTSYMLPDKSYVNSMRVDYTNLSTGKDDGSLTVFQNPASAHCTVFFGQDQEQDRMLLVMDTGGRIVLSQRTGKLQGRMFRLDTSSLASGTYQLQVIGMKAHSSAKLVIVR